MVCGDRRGIIHGWNWGSREKVSRIYLRVDIGRLGVGTVEGAFEGVYITPHMSNP